LFLTTFPFQSLPVTVKVAPIIWTTVHTLKTMQLLKVNTLQWESLQYSWCSHETVHENNHVQRKWKFMESIESNQWL